MVVDSDTSSSTTGAGNSSSSPRIASSSTSTDEHKGSIQLDMLSVPFVPFNPLAVSEPYDNDARNEPEFEKEITRAMLEVVLEFHAWSSARPKYETQVHGAELSDEVGQIANTEERQGTFDSVVEQARVKLIQFVAQIKSAVHALTNFGL